MKKFLVIAALSFVACGLTAQPYTWTAILGGDGLWTSSSNWLTLDGAPYDYPQTSDDIVVIKDVPFILAMTSVSVKSITIDNSFFATQLIINDGTSVTTTDDVILQGLVSTNSSIVLGNGSALNVGDGPEDGLTLDGLITASGYSVLNTSGYFYHSSGQINLSGDLDINISTSGAIPSSTDQYNYFVGNLAEYVISGTPEFNINIENGNLGTKAEIYIENATVTNNSTGGQTTLTLKNTDGTDNSFSFLTDMNLGKVNIDIGTGNTVVFDNLTNPPAGDVFFKGLNVLSGEFEMATGSLLTVDPSSDGL
jgi:hypothetical protein